MKVHTHCNDQWKFVTGLVLASVCLYVKTLQVTLYIVSPDIYLDDDDCVCYINSFISKNLQVF